MSLRDDNDDDNKNMVRILELVLSIIKFHTTPFYLPIVNRQGTPSDLESWLH